MSMIVEQRVKRKWNEIGGDSSEASQETLYMKAIKLLSDSSPSTQSTKSIPIAQSIAQSVQMTPSIVKICGCHRETKLWLVELSDSTRVWKSYDIVVQTNQFRNFIEQRAEEGLFTDSFLNQGLFRTVASYIA